MSWEVTVPEIDVDEMILTLSDATEVRYSDPIKRDEGTPVRPPTVTFAERTVVGPYEASEREERGSSTSDSEGLSHERGESDG